MSSNLETAFLYWWRLLADDFPEPVAEYKFHPRRRWRFDYAFVEHQVAIELDGGTYANGRHNRGAGFRADCEKVNAATVAGWHVLRFTSDMLRDDPERCIEQVKTLLEAA